MISETDPEVVLLDVSMPVMGGFATASELRRIAPELPVVFVSQHAGAEYVAEAFRLGARGYVLKAAIYSELDEAIESVQRNELYRSARLAS
jgi:DNA-binding NarL/FixJ family response regulator